MKKVVNRVLSFASFPSSEHDKSTILFNSKDQTQMCLFYADWCGHCVRFKPTWDACKRERSKRIKWIEFDCSNKRDMATQFEIQSFPTILKIKNQQQSEFTGERTKVKLLKFANE